MSADELTDRQRQLHAEVVKSATAVQERLLMLTVHATRVGASERDVTVVREVLLEGHVRECGDSRSR